MPFPDQIHFWRLIQGVHFYQALSIVSSKSHIIRAETYNQKIELQSLAMGSADLSPIFR